MARAGADCGALWVSWRIGGVGGLLPTLAAVFCAYKKWIKEGEKYRAIC
jgi:uncharacterized membrane protein YesL